MANHANKSKPSDKSTNRQMFGQLIVHPRFPLYPTIEKSMRKHNLSESKKCYPYLIRARKKYTATDPNEVIVGGAW